MIASVQLTPTRLSRIRTRLMVYVCVTSIVTFLATILSLFRIDLSDLSDWWLSKNSLFEWIVTINCLWSAHMRINSQNYFSGTSVFDYRVFRFLFYSIPTNCATVSSKQFLTFYGCKTRSLRGLVWKEIRRLIMNSASSKWSIFSVAVFRKFGHK